jgi:23S rRNA pseudouridine1911/1915/1917 synthase
MALNRGYEYRETVAAGGGGVPLIDYLVARYPHSTRGEWLERIGSGAVLLDGERCSPDLLLEPGRTITWRRPPWEEPDAPTIFAVLYRDRDLLAVAKPAGLPTLPSGGFLDNTLLSLVRKHDPEASPLHRLGRWTSGLVLFARTGEARSVLSGQWRAGSVIKIYLALASGEPAAEELILEYPIGSAPHDLLGTVHAATPGGKPSRTVVRVLERRDGAFLAEARIETGRPHQIRIHMAAAGHPLVGDPLYGTGGVPESGCTALPGDPGYHLHAAVLRFDHPATGRALELRCESPPVLRRDTCR